MLSCCYNRCCLINRDVPLYAQINEDSLEVQLSPWNLLSLTATVTELFTNFLELREAVI